MLSRFGKFALRQLGTHLLLDLLDFGQAARLHLADMQLRKFDSGGSHQWSRQVGSSNDDYVFTNGVARDSSNAIFVGGKTAGALSGFTNAGGSDAFVMKLDSSGTVVWTLQFGTTGDELAAGIRTLLAQTYPAST